MFIPGKFVPSHVNHQTHYDEEGRLRTFRIGMGEDGGVGEANSLYATQAEYFGSRAPFIKNNQIRDAKRRNYIIQPGGACIYFETERELEDPYGGGRVQYTAPSDKESFGHNSMDGSKMPNPGVQFTVGSASDKGV